MTLKCLRLEFFRAEYTVICRSVWLLAECAEQLEGSEQVCACLAHNSTVPLLFVSVVGLFLVCCVSVSVVGGLLLFSSPFSSFLSVDVWCD